MSQIRLGIITTVYCNAPTSTYMLRSLVESIQREVPRSAYDTLLVVDDCSPEQEPHAAYLKHLTDHEIARVYRLGGSQPIAYYHSDADGGVVRGGERTSFGLAVGVMAGFEALRAMGCTHAWLLDADSVVLNGACVAEALRLFRYDGVAVVADYLGGYLFPGRDRVCGMRWEDVYDAGTGEHQIRTSKDDQPVRSALRAYGFPNTSCLMVDLNAELRGGGLINAGWIHSRWMHRLFRQGHRVGFSPFYQGRSVFHLGFGFAALNNESFGARTFGNAVSTARYGGKSSGEYHAGYLQWGGTNTEYTAWLEKAYGGVAPDVLVPFPTDRLIEPPGVAPGSADRYMRRTGDEGADVEFIEIGHVVATGRLDILEDRAELHVALTATGERQSVKSERYTWAVGELFEQAFNFWERTVFVLRDTPPGDALATRLGAWHAEDGAWVLRAGRVEPGPPDLWPASRMLKECGVTPWTS